MKPIKHPKKYSKGQKSVGDYEESAKKIFLLRKYLYLTYYLTEQ